jgi:hypothetical protein
MNAIVGTVAEVLLLGSIALLVWGAILTLGQLFRTDRERSAADAARSPGEERRQTERAGLASPRRRRFGRLSPH